MIKILFALLFAVNLFSYDRIIALSPSINEIIYALGKGDKIVGNTEYCKYPEDSKTKAKVGGYFSPNLEKILSLKPDLVIMQNSSYKLSKQLEKLGIKTQVSKLEKLKDIKDTIKVIGELLDEKQKAKELLSNIGKALEDTKGIIKDQRILIVIDHKLSIKKRVFVTGQNLYFDDIINISGNTNAFQSKRMGQPVLDMENIIATNPDIIILLAPFKDKYKLTNEQLIKPWLSLPVKASKAKKIYVIGKDYAGISSDRIIYFLDDFKRILLSAKDR